MRKLFVSKNEGVAGIVEKIIAEKEGEIVLVVPKEAEIGDSEENFELLKREASSMDKIILIESIDEKILALARTASLRAVHPLFEKGAGKSPAVSDIIPKKKISKNTETSSFRESKVEKTKHIVQEKQDVPSRALEEKRDYKITKRQPVSPVERGKPEIEDYSLRERRKIRIPKKSAAIVGAVLLISLGGAWIAGGQFSRATILINFNKTPWNHQGVFLADSSVSKIDAEKNILPAELFSLEKNSTQLFPASGEEDVERKAKGEIWIYNAYSSSPQDLVATTRFETPDGKIFRIVDRVRVPGAEIKDGKIIPSSIKVAIVADKPGEAYNVNPVPRLVIPGFKGSPRFDGFYGEIKEATKGGFVGRKAVPTSEDIKKAKERMSEILKSGLEMNFANGLPEGFKILEMASEISIIRLSVDENTNEEGKFSVFGEAHMRAVGFREQDVEFLLNVLANKEQNGMDFKELNLEFNNVKPDFSRGAVSFSLSANGVLWPKFSAEDLRSKVLGKRVEEVRSLVSGISGLASAKVSLWPVWLKSVPADPEKVKVVVE